MVNCSEEGGSHSSAISGTDHCRNTMPDQEVSANFIAQTTPDSQPPSSQRKDLVVDLPLVWTRSTTGECIREDI